MPEIPADGKQTADTAAQSTPLPRNDDYTTAPLSDLREKKQQGKFFCGLFLLVRCTTVVFAVMLCYRLAVSPETFSAQDSGDAAVFLSQGDRGDAVRQIQAALLSLGYDVGYANGIYSLRTARAVRAFQEEHGLTADGICTAATKLLLFALTDTDADAVTDTAVYDDMKTAQLSSALAVFEETYENADLYTLTCAAAVVCNRLKSEDYPDTLSAVLGGIFAELSLSSGMTAEADDICRRAAEDALRGQDPTDGALHIETTVSSDGVFLVFG